MGNSIALFSSIFILLNNRMIKNFVFVLTILICTLFIGATKSYACDPLGCLMGGHKANTLILGEVLSANNNLKEVKIISVFPQTTVKSLKNGDIISFNENEQNTVLKRNENETEVGKKYLMSLNKVDSLYIPAWGIFEIAGENYADAQLLENTSLDDEALQIFLNSGGKETDFAFDYSGQEPILYLNNKIIEPKEKSSDLKEATSVLESSKIPSDNDISDSSKNNKIVWYSVGLGILIFLGGIVIFSKKKK